MTNETQYCDHICSGNCRREGCNCACGEYHNEDGIVIDEDDSLEVKAGDFTGYFNREQLL